MAGTKQKAPDRGDALTGEALVREMMDKVGQALNAVIGCGHVRSEILRCAEERLRQVAQTVTLDVEQLREDRDAALRMLATAQPDAFSAAYARVDSDRSPRGADVFAKGGAL